MTDHQPSILIVDDEPSIITALQKLVEDENWNCTFAENAHQALNIMQEHRFDLVVTDVIMPGKNGFALLNEIKELYPWTVRIFLTAFARQDTVIQALADGCAQQIIPKPWIEQELKEIIHSALRQSQQQRKYGPDFQALINSIPLLPPLPASYSAVKDCIARDEVDFDQMAAIISQDVALSSALLHWANSALFGQRFQVDTIKKAIVVLGSNIVVNLVLSEAINRTIAEWLPHDSKFKLDEFQRHSFAAAIISRQLIKNVYCNDQEKQDRAFVAGLLHDMGKLAAASYFSKKFSAAEKLAEQERCYLADAEKRIMGATHGEIGGFLAEWWTLPPFIVNAIQWHHDPKSSPIERDIIDAVHVANLLSYQFGFGTSGNTHPREVIKECWDKFYLSDEGVEILQAETEEMLQMLVGE